MYKKQNLDSMDTPISPALVALSKTRNPTLIGPGILFALEV